MKHSGMLAGWRASRSRAHAQAWDKAESALWKVTEEIEVELPD